MKQRKVDVVIVGGGQAGLAMSRCLLMAKKNTKLTADGDEDISHVILERGPSVGTTWRNMPWQSLRLLTPNWQTRLPYLDSQLYHHQYPDNFMSKHEFVQLLEEYAAPCMDAQVLRTNTTVTSITYDKEARLYAVQTIVRRPGETEDEIACWRSAAVVLCTGHCAIPRIPQGLDKQIPPDDIRQLHALHYDSPQKSLHPSGGNVLVVGASGSGVQIARELALHFRQSEKPPQRKVWLSTGRHFRMPRRYRNRDMLWWLDQMGFFAASAHFSADTDNPAPQLQGSARRNPSEHETVDLNALQELGVSVVGRVQAVVHEEEDETALVLQDNLRELVGAADAKLKELLRNIDAFIEAKLDKEHLSSIGHAEEMPPPTHLPESIPTRLDLRQANITTIVWATGYRRDYGFLNLPLKFTELGDIADNDGGIIRSQPGLFVLGVRFLRRKDSHFVDGVGRDAEHLTEHLAAVLGAQ